MRRILHERFDRGLALLFSIEHRLRVVRLGGLAQLRLGHALANCPYLRHRQRPQQSQVARFVVKNFLYVSQRRIAVDSLNHLSKAFEIHVDPARLVLDNEHRVTLDICLQQFIDCREALDRLFDNVLGIGQFFLGNFNGLSCYPGFSRRKRPGRKISAGNAFYLGFT